MKGTIRINVVTLGSNSCTREEELKFYIVDIDSSYNAILGTPTHRLYVPPTGENYYKKHSGIRKKSPKSLLGYMMKSRKHLNDECRTSEIGSILVTEEIEIEKTPRWQVFELPAGTSKQEEFEEVIIHPNHPSQKVQNGKEMPLCLRNKII